MHSSHQSGEPLIMEHKDHTGCRQVFRVLPVFAPVNTDLTFSVDEIVQDGDI